MTNLKNIEQKLDKKFNDCEESLAQEALQEAVLKTQIASIDDTLYGFRDLAGSYLRKGDGLIMARYKTYKYKLDQLVCLYKDKTGQDLTNRLKCNR